VDAPAAVCRHAVSSAINSGYWCVSWFRGVVDSSLHTNMHNAAAAIGGNGDRGCWHQQQWGTAVMAGAGVAGMHTAVEPAVEPAVEGAAAAGAGASGSGSSVIAVAAVAVAV
jgi:hypothetical protein